MATKSVILNVFFAALAVASFALLASCGGVKSKLAEAENDFDSGNYESAQFKYFELISNSEGEERTQVAESYLGRVSALVSQSSFDSSKYAEWAAVFDTMPDYRSRLDGIFAASLLSRAKALLDEGELSKSAILVGYLPSGHDDGGLGAEIAKAQKAKESEIFEAGRKLYLDKEFDKAIEEWSKLDPGSELGKKAEEIKARIPKEKFDHFLAEARKRQVKGFKINTSGPTSRIIYNRVEGQTFDMDSASEGRQLLRIEATISEDINLYAWYIENNEFVNLGRLQREIMILDIDNPEEIKRIYKRNIVSGRPVEVVYFMSTEYDFYRIKKIYVSTEFTPRTPEDLSKISVVHSF